MFLAFKKRSNCPNHSSGPHQPANKNPPRKISLSLHPLTLFGKPCHTPKFEARSMFSTPDVNPAQINL